MHMFKMLGMVFLALYLILSGLVDFTGFELAPIGMMVISLLSIASGACILFAACKCGSCCDKCGK